MPDADLPITTDPAGSRPLYAVRPGDLAAFLAGLPPPQAAFLQAGGFTAAAQQLVLLPDAGGLGERGAGSGR